MWCMCVVHVCVHVCGACVVHVWCMCVCICALFLCCICLSVCVWVCMGVYGCVWVCMGVYGCVWVCMCVCVVFMCVWYTHIVQEIDFGYACIYLKCRCESCNSSVLLQNIYGNKKAPSRDIGNHFATVEHLCYISGGGLFNSNERLDI